MSWYYDYKPTIETDEGIKAKSKRGAFVKNWWASRWIEQMEKLMDRGRLSRGRTYARKGQVLSLTEDRGEVSARVQGSRSRPYKITIRIKPLSEKDWDRVLEALLARPIFMAQLLAGEMPQDIEEAFAAVKLSLFPSKSNDLTQECNCPDYAEVCKHLAAVHYILAERFDEDPFLLFRLRGRSQEAILAVLAQHYSADEDNDSEAAYEPPAPLSMEGFWDVGRELSHFRTRIAPPDIAYPVLVRLGAPGFMEDIEAKLGPVYDRITQATLDAVFGDDQLSADGEEMDDIPE